MRHRCNTALRKPARCGVASRWPRR